MCIRDRARTYQQDALQRYDEVYGDDGYNEELEEELNLFAHEWFQTIEKQGYVPVQEAAELEAGELPAEEENTLELAPSWEQGEPAKKAQSYDLYPEVSGQNRHQYQIMEEVPEYGSAKEKFRANIAAKMCIRDSYGATSGKAFINGVAGERFCVRNSGATAVVEGVGDHGCEYMTGGRVAVLGKTGKNFAAGMSGGIAYVLDLNNDLYKKVNKEMVNIERVTDKYDVLELKDMIKEHVAYTNSEVGKEILENFKDYLPKFKKIIPEDYEKMMSAILQMEEKGLSSEQAKIEAFNKIKNGR